MQWKCLSGNTKGIGYATSPSTPGICHPPAHTLTLPLPLLATVTLHTETNYICKGTSKSQGITIHTKFLPDLTIWWPLPLISTVNNTLKLGARSCLISLKFQKKCTKHTMAFVGQRVQAPKEVQDSWRSSIQQKKFKSAKEAHVCQSNSSHQGVL